MAIEIQSTIGTAAGRDYATISAWEADTDDDLVSQGVAHKGLLYADADFDEAVIFEGAITDSSHFRRLQPAAGERHSGLRNTGARMFRSTGASENTLQIKEDYFVLDGIEFTTAGDGTGSGFVQCIWSGTASGEDLQGIRILRCLIYDITRNQTNVGIVTGATSNEAGTGWGGTIANNIVMHVEGSSEGRGIQMQAQGDVGRTAAYANNTVYSCLTWGFVFLGDSGMGSHSVSIRNNAAFDNGIDFSDETVSPPNISSFNNASSDATADDFGGGGHKINLSASNNFVDLTAGAEDLHIQASTDLGDAGLDLGDVVQKTDIDLRDRHFQEDTWDIGAHEYPQPIDFTAWTVEKFYDANNALVESDQHYVPVCLVLDGDADLQDAAADGSDLRVTNEAGDRLYRHEIEELVTTAGSEKLVLYFLIPFLDASAPVRVALHWGNGAAADKSDADALWANYEAVYHLNGDVLDSLGNHDGSMQTHDGSAVGITEVPGALASGLHTPGDPNYLDLGSIGAWTDMIEAAFYVSAWAKPDDGHPTNNQFIFGHNNESSGTSPDPHRFYWLILREGLDARSGGLQLRYSGNSPDFDVADEMPGIFGDGATAWTHIAAQFDPGRRTTRKWANGAEQAVTVFLDDAATLPLPTGWIGDSSEPLVGMARFETQPSPSIFGFYIGALDELRFRVGVVQEGWPETEYENLDKPGTGSGEFWGQVITNAPPDKPTLAVDENRATGAAFSSSAFSDPDGDAHDSSRWQVDEAGGDFSSPVHDSGWTALNLEDYDTGDGVYPSGADYIARVAHRDPAGEFTWSDPVAFTAPALAELSSVEGLFFGQSGGNNLWQFGGAHLDLSSPITCRMRTAPVGPGGVGGEALFHNLYLALEWQSEGTVEVIPIVDGDRRTDLSRTINLAQKAEPTRDRFEIPLVYGFEDGGVEVLRQALRGTWFQAELLVTLSRPSVHGIMVEGVELEQELVRESHPAVSYTIESLDDVDHEQAVPWYVGAGGDLLEGDTGVTDDGAGITARIQTSEVAPAGPGGEAAFHNVYLALTRSNPLDATLTLTPIVDGVDQDARNLTLAGVAGPLTEVLEVPLTQGFDVGGVEELRHALRGAFFSLRLEAGVPDGALVFEGLELETEIVREGEAAVAG